MDAHLEHIIDSISKGDTTHAANLLLRPGGKKYLEHLVLILINTLPQQLEDKEELYHGFVTVLNRIEKGLRQREGKELLEGVFRTDAQ